MGKSLKSREHQRLLEIAREYRQLGYEVILAPSAEQAPDFLAPFHLDMIARSQKENVVVEVRSQISLTEAPRLDAIAKAVEDKEDWRFELVVTNSKERNGLYTKDAKLLEQADIRYRLQEVRDLTNEEYSDAAFLLVWSVLEAILRNRVESEHLDLAQDTSPYLLKSLFTYGLLNQEQYQILQTALQTRNLMIHGYKAKIPFSALLNDLLSVADQLITDEFSVLQPS
ncbi:MAG: hypothetical protein R3C14_03390 [Caldilineaceae bacterium]